MNNEFSNYLARLNISILGYGLYESLKMILFLSEENNTLNNTLLNKVESVIENIDSNNKYLKSKAAFDLLSIYFHNGVSVKREVDLRLCEPGLIIKALSHKVEKYNKEPSIFLKKLREDILNGKFTKENLKESFYEDNILGLAILVLSKVET